MGRPLEPGDPAPDFTLANPAGPVSGASFRGKTLVLYFYPRADTPGCTQEALDFNRLLPRFRAAGTEVLGVSADPVKAIERFGTKHGFAFALAADPAHEALEAYGVWAEKQLYGRRYMGIVRSTFVIDADGRIARIWRNVKVKGHAEEVLAAAQEIGSRKRV